MYKLAFWLLFFVVYMVCFWWLSPGYGFINDTNSYIDRVIAGHVLVFPIVSIAILFSWLAVKAGYS